MRLKPLPVCLSIHEVCEVEVVDLYFVGLTLIGVGADDDFDGSTMGLGNSSVDMPTRKDSACLLSYLPEKG